MHLRSDHSFAYPSVGTNDMLASSPSLWSPSPRGIGGEGFSAASSSLPSSQFLESQPQMVSTGSGEDAILRIQGINNHNTPEINNSNGTLGHLDVGDPGSTADIVTPRPSHQTSVPMPTPQNLEMMVENGDIGRAAADESGRQHPSLIDGMYNSFQQENSEDSIMHSPPRAEDDQQNHQDGYRESRDFDSDNNQQYYHQKRSHLQSPAAHNQSSSVQTGGAQIETIAQIGRLLEEVVSLANSAREHFNHGEHTSSSSALGDLQRKLGHIGQLGTQSLAIVQQGRVDDANFSSVLPQIQTQSMPALSHRRTDTASSLSSNTNSPLSRKRPIDERDDHLPQQLLSEAQSQPLAQHPQQQQLHPSLSNSDLRSNALTPVQPPSAPPSAPPNLTAVSSSMPQSDLAASSSPSTIYPRPGLFQTVSASTVPQLHEQPQSDLQQQFQQQQQQGSFPSASGSQSVPGSYASSPTAEQGFMFPSPSAHQMPQQQQQLQQRQNHRQLPQLATGSPQSSVASGTLGGAPNSAGGNAGSLMQHSFVQSMPPSPVDRANAASSMRAHSRGSSLAGAVSPTHQLHQQQGNNLTSMANEALNSAASNGGHSTGNSDALQSALRSEARAKEDLGKAQSKQSQSLDFNLGFGFEMSDYQNSIDGIGNRAGVAASDNASFSAPSSPRDDSYSSWSNTNADSTDFDEMGGFESSHSSLFRFGNHVGTDLEDNEWGGQQQLPDLIKDTNQLHSSDPSGMQSELSLPGVGSSSSSGPSAANNGGGSSSSGLGPRRSPRQTIRAQQTQGRKARSYSSPRNSFQSLSSNTIKGHRPQRSEAGSASVASSIHSHFNDDTFTPRVDHDQEDAERTLRIKKISTRPTNIQRRSRSSVRKDEESEDEDGVEDEDDEREPDAEEETEETENHEHELDDEGEGMGINASNLPSASRKIPNVSSDIKALFDTVFHDFLSRVCSDPHAADNSGQSLSMTLMPQRVAEQNETEDFNIFKFRIQPFSDAFETELLKRGFDPDDCNSKNVRAYLRNQTLIGRFNEDGKKNKTKGTTVWIVEAKKLSDSSWQFKEFTPKFAGVDQKTAYVGEQWSWTLRVWDPQTTAGSVKAVYEVEVIPDWIHVPSMVAGAPFVLSGTPQASDVGSKKIQVTAVYRAANHLHRLRHSFFLQVTSRRGHLKRASRPIKASTSSIPQNNASASDPSHALPANLTEIKDDSDNRSIHTIRPDESSGSDQADHQRGQQQQQAQPMEGVESFFHETLPPAQVSAFVSSLPFQVPFTPPIMEGRKDYLGLGQQAQISAAQQVQMQAQAQAQEADRNRLDAMQSISERQQHNASQLTLSLPMGQKNGMSNEGVGLHTSSPMSSMPQQLDSTLPLASSNYTLGMSSIPTVTPGLSGTNNPTFSPALDPASFNPLDQLSMDQ